MKGIICITIVILILIGGWLWFRPILQKIWGKYREEFSLKNTEDPVFIFRLLFDIAEYNANPQLNYNIPYKHSILSVEERQSFLDRITSTGVTFESRIVQVQTSAKLPKGHLSGLETTGLTTIICDKDHYCLPGANISIKGIAGLEGYYKNGVSLISFSNEKRDSSDRIDVSYDNPITKGSALGFLHSFLLIKDSSTLQSIENGIDKGYLSSDLTESRVEVIHKVYSEMPYNEWISSVLTTLSYLYGCNSSTYIVGYGTDLYGKVVNDWKTLSLNSSYSSRCYTKNGNRIEPMQGFVINVGKRYSNQGSNIKQIYSMFTRFWMNDPYEVDKLFSKYFSPYIVDDYDLIGIPDTYGPNTSLNIIPILNYLKKGSVKNVYWGLKGSGQKTKEQEDICRSLNMFNVDEKSILGGTELVGKLFDWVNPYEYEEVKKGRMNPDPQTWIILGGKNTEDGRDRKSCYMDYYCGIVKEEFTNGKKVGYIFFSNFLFKQTVANGTANYFSGSLPKGFESYESNSFLKGQYALMKVLAPMMRYLVTDEKCESIIIDIRGNEGGGEYSVCLASFFGDVRSGIIFYRVKNDTGYSYPLSVTRDGYGTAFEKIWSDLANTFEGSSFRGTKTESKKVILLHSYGTLSSFSTYFIGNKGNNYIGSNTYSVIIGSKDLGTIAKTLSGGINLPTISSKIKYTIEYSLLSGDIRMFSVQEGPLFNKTTYSDGFWNKVYGTAEIPSSLKGLSGGSSLRNDMGLLYYSFGIVKAPDDLFIKYSSFIEPNSNDPLTWKDPWLEQSIRESVSEIIPLDEDSVYPRFELERKENLNIIDNTSFVLESGQTIVSTNMWSLSSFNLQLNFIIENGILQFDPRGADDKGNTLVPMGNKSESVFVGFLNESNKPVYGITISSELYTDSVYAIGFFVGKVIKQFNTKITFPSAISILIQENSQIYFTVNGYHMYQGNATITTDIPVKVGATCSNNLKDKKSVLVIKEVSLQ